MMVKGIALILLFGIVGLAACSSGPEPPLGRELSVRWNLLTNFTPSGFASELILFNRGDSPLPASGWTIYFNLARKLDPASVDGPFRIEQINGDFYRLRPGEGLLPLAPGRSAVVRFQGEASIINKSVAPAGYYIVYDRDPIPQRLGSEEVGPFESREQTSRSPEDQVPLLSPESLFRENAHLTSEAGGPPLGIVPTPVSLVTGAGTLLVGPEIRIAFEPGLESEASQLADSLSELLDVRLTSAEAADPLPGPGSIVLKVGDEPGNSPEAYRLTVSAKQGVIISGSSPAGVFYGIQSLRAWFPISAWERRAQSAELREVELADRPRFSYRGQHLDVARNFRSAGEVRRLLDLMAFYKLNRFHFHLTDDEGWRLEIADLPELTDIGSRRGHTLNESDRLVPSFGSGPDPDPSASSGSGFYTRQEYVELLRHAARLHIEVIPEIDVPGHARAAIKSMQARYHRLMREGAPSEADRYLLNDPEDESDYRTVQGWNDNVLNVCQESTYFFLETVIDELRAMHLEAEVPLRHVHVGGDELPAGVWEGSPRCRAMAEQTGIEGRVDLTSYFFDRLDNLLSSRGLAVAGWEEVGLIGPAHGEAGAKRPNPKFAGRRFLVYPWNSIWGWGGEENAYQLANAGFQVVLCNASSLYFDLASAKHPEEPGYYWAGFVDTRDAWELIPLDIYRGAERDVLGRPIDPDHYRDAARLRPEGVANIVGLQGTLWAENQKSGEIMEYLVFPKLLGLAERAWAQSPEWAETADESRAGALREAAWSRFASLLGHRELPRLDFWQGGIAYRIPPPGAVVEDGLLKANASYPGLTIRYSLDGNEPDAGSPVYESPVPLEGEAILRTFDRRGRGSRVSRVP